MLLSQVLFGTFNPPPIVMTRRITNIGEEKYAGGYVPSSLQRTIEKRRAQREKDQTKVIDLLRDGTARTTNQIAIELNWGHNKMSNIMDTLFRDKRVVRDGRRMHKTGGPRTYFYSVP